MEIIYGVKATCPVCLKDGLYIRSTDHIHHEDGTDSAACWRRITRGDVKCSTVSRLAEKAMQSAWRKLSR